MEKIKELANILEENVDNIEDCEERMRVRRIVVGLYIAMRAELGISTVKQLADEILK